MGLGQYIKDTQAELRHVAWPTQMQTIVYTILVVAISVFVSLYLGLFDYLFTGILERVVIGAPAAEVTHVPDTGSSSVNITPVLSTSTQF